MPGYQRPQAPLGRSPAPRGPAVSGPGAQGPSARGPARPPMGRGNGARVEQVLGPSREQAPAEGPGGEQAEAIPEIYAAKSEVWKMGYEDGLSQGRAGAARIDADPATQGAITKASTATGVDADNLKAMAIIESTGDRNVGTNAYGYSGLMQMGADAAADVGMSFAGMKGAKNVDNNALGGAKYWQLNAERLDEDIPRDPLHLYLAHQQGAGGTNALMKNMKTAPDTKANGAQRNNLPAHVIGAISGKPTQKDFYDYWAGKMQAIQDEIAAAKVRAP